MPTNLVVDNRKDESAWTLLNASRSARSCSTRSSMSAQVPKGKSESDVACVWKPTFCLPHNKGCGAVTTKVERAAAHTCGVCTTTRVRCPRGKWTSGAEQVSTLGFRRRALCWKGQRNPHHARSRTNTLFTVQQSHRKQRWEPWLTSGERTGDDSVGDGPFACRSRLRRFGGLRKGHTVHCPTVQHRCSTCISSKPPTCACACTCTCTYTRQKQNKHQERKQSSRCATFVDGASTTPCDLGRPPRDSGDEGRLPLVVVLPAVRARRARRDFPLPRRSPASCACLISVANCPCVEHASGVWCWRERMGARGENTTPGTYPTKRLLVQHGWYRL